jgi:trimeric autotransporter adhesin
MSTKTLRKRIALVAVSALGAGLLSVVAVPSANAATADTFEIAIDNSATGTASANQTIATATSMGWVTKTSDAGVQTGTASIAATGGAAVTGVILSGAQIAFGAGGTGSAVGVSVVVTGGTLSQVADTNSAAGVTLSVNGSATIAVAASAGATDSNLIGVATANGAVGSTMTLTMYSGTGVTGTSSATAGTIVGRYTLTIASASSSGTYSAADSSVYAQSANTRGVACDGTDAYDRTSRQANGTVGCIWVDLEDAYGAAITSGNLTASATNDALVVVADTAAAADTYSASASFSSYSTNTSDGAYYITVNQPVANTAGSTVVTITFDGQVIGTKTISWQGDIATLSVDTVNSCGSFTIGATAATPAVCSGGIIWVAKDAAGNAVTTDDLPDMFSATGALVGATIDATENTTSGVVQTSSVGYGTMTMVVPGSTSLRGAATYQVFLTNAVGTVIKSQVVNATVSNGSTNSFAVSWDKAVYNPGDIATMTVELKDIYGNLMADGTLATGWAHAVGGDQLTAVGSACSATSFTLGGKFTCKYGVGNTAGSYTHSTDLTTVTAQSATVGSIKIVESTAGVSNADVLKAIVSLIASINKQIAALQKALLKR